MEYKEHILSSIQSLKINPVRTGLTMLGMIIGTSAVILIASVGQSAIKYVTNELYAFGTNFFQISAGGNLMAMYGGAAPKPFTIEDVKAVEDAGIPNIESAAPIAFASRNVSANNIEKTVSVYGMTPAGFDMLKPTMIYGEGLSDDESNSKVVVLGTDVAEKLFGEESDPVGESVKIEDSRFRVIGVSKAGGNVFGSFFNSAIVIPVEVVNDQIRGDDDLVEIDFSVKNTNLIDETMKDIELFFRDRRGINEGQENDFTIISMKESLNIIETVTGLLTMLIAGISAISLVVGGVGVMNIMLVSVVERTKEIGLLKSIGAKEKDILIQFLIESVIITVFGGGIGVIIGITLSLFISLIARLPFVLSIPWIIIAVVVSSLVGIVFGLYPARRAAKLSPIDALRSE